MPKIVVGLGNPGAKYAGTRHNVGFDVLDSLYSKYGSPSAKIEATEKTASIDIGSTKLILVWPLTYMNNSGRFVQPIVQFYKINKAEDLLIVCDDLSLPLGKLRIRPQGSAGGQKGLADILQRLGDQQVPRLRIGSIQRPLAGILLTMCSASFAVRKGKWSTRQCSRPAKPLKLGVKTTFSTA